MPRIERTRPVRTALFTGSLPACAGVLAVAGIYFGGASPRIHSERGSLMRRTFMVLAALSATLLAAAAGTAAPPSVTISLSRPAVVYGASVTLSGKVSDSKV